MTKKASAVNLKMQQILSVQNNSELYFKEGKKWLEKPRAAGTHIMRKVGH